MIETFWHRFKQWRIGKWYRVGFIPGRETVHYDLPLTFAVSTAHFCSIHYKPGKENFVADTLSRQNVNALQDEPLSDMVTVHSEISLTYTIETIR